MLGNIAVNSPEFKERRRLEKERLENQRKLAQLRAFLLEKLNEAIAQINALEISRANYSKPEYMRLSKNEFNVAVHILTAYKLVSTNRIVNGFIPTVSSITDDATYQIAREQLMLEIEKIVIYRFCKAYYGWTDVNETRRTITKFYPSRMLVKFQEIIEIVNEIWDALQLPVAGGRRRKSRKTRKARK